MTKASEDNSKRAATKTQASTPAALKSKRDSEKVDESSDESFPASDAPASYGGKDIAPHDRKPS